MGGYVKVQLDDWYYAMVACTWRFQMLPRRTTTGYIFRALLATTACFLWAKLVSGLPSVLPLSGKYVFGGYYWGLENTSFNGETYEGRFGFYWQADQMLWREPSAATAKERDTAGKTPKPSAAVKPKLSDQGLYSFSFFNFAPLRRPRPFHFHMGLATRDSFRLAITINLEWSLLSPITATSINSCRKQANDPA